MGREEFPAVPVLVDRRAEIDRIRSVLDGAGTAESPLLLIRGEAGTGKTRLVQEAATEAERRGRSVVFGTARAESTAPYHVWAAPLRQLGIDYLLEDAPPPRLMGLYLLDVKGHPLVRVERDLDPDSGSTADATTFAPDPSGPGKRLLGGGLYAFNRSGRRLLVFERPDARLCAAVEGHEDEVFLEELRKLVDVVGIGALGQAPGTAQAFKDLLNSGKYEGTDYAKGDPKLRQSRLFQNAALGVARNAELRPLLIVLDDLQWADPSSLALLAYVARNFRRSDALFLGTYRVEEGSVRPHLQEALDRMAREGLFAELSLGGLSRRDLGPLAESFIGPHGLPEPFLDLLWHETGGNPLIVREVLRGLEGDGAIHLHGASKKLVTPPAELSIPRRVREAVRARLERVPKEDRRLLEAASACGTRFTAAMVARLVGEAEGTVLNGFGSIAGVHGFLRGGESDFAFDHPAVREVLYEDMGDDVRRVYHREAAEWLELAGGPPEDVADHLYRARDIRAVERLRQVAQTAQERYANAEAVRFYTEALELEQRLDRRGELLEALGSVYKLLGGYDSSLECYVKAFDMASETDRRAKILVRVAHIHYLKGEFEECLGKCKQALGLVGGMSSQEEALALVQIGAVHLSKGDYDAALGYFNRSLAIQERIGDQDGMARSLNNMGILCEDRGDYKAALEYHGRSLEIEQKKGDIGGVAASLNNIGAVHWAQADYDAALEHFNRSLAMRERVGDLDGIARSLGNVGNAYYSRGDYDMTLEYWGRSLEIWERIGNPRALALMLTNLGSLHGDRGESDAALDCSGRSLAICERIGDRVGVVRSLKEIGSVHAEAGNPDLAVEYLRKALDVLSGVDDSRSSAETHCTIALAELRRGNLGKAFEYGQVALSTSEKTGQKDIIAASRRALGMIHRERRMWPESIEDFEKSVQVSTEIRQPLEQSKSEYEFGLMWKAYGDAAKARAHLLIAAGLFEKLKLSKQLRKVAEARQDLPAR